MKFSHYQKSIHGASYIHVSVLSDEGPTLEKLDYTLPTQHTMFISVFGMSLYCIMCLSLQNIKKIIYFLSLSI